MREYHVHHAILVTVQAEGRTRLEALRALISVEFPAVSPLMEQGGFVSFMVPPDGFVEFTPESAACDLKRTWLTNILRASRVDFAEVAYGGQAGSALVLREGISEQRAQAVALAVRRESPAFTPEILDLSDNSPSPAAPVAVTVAVEASEDQVALPDAYRAALPGQGATESPSDVQEAIHEARQHEIPEARVRQWLASGMSPQEVVWGLRGGTLT